MKTMQEVREFYESALQADLAILEDVRKKIITRFGMALAIALAGLTLLAVLLTPQPPDNRKGIIILALIVAGIALSITYTILTRTYRANFKDTIIQKLVQFIDASLRYEKNNAITEHKFRAAKIFLTTPDRYRGEDYISGTIDKTRLEFSEIHAEYKTEHVDSKGRRQTRWHTIFKGIFFIADFNKHFHGQTVVLPDTAERLLGGIGTLFQSWNIMRGQLIKLEDPEFERHFAVYGTDQIEARYILSPSLMSRIVTFKQKSNSRVFLSFVASQVNVAISSQKNFFEPRVFRTVLDFALIQEYVADLQLAVGIVDELNLNTRIWNKE